MTTRQYLASDAALTRARRLLYDHRARAKKDGVHLDYGLAELQQLLESPCCSYCSLPMAWDVSIDHKIAISRGGRHQLANLAVCCSRCNQAKGLLTDEEFVQLRELLKVFHPAAQQDVLCRLRAGGKRYAGRSHTPRMNKH
jgi:5-methylcytosine-specific restriction endonuclease McrA